MHDKALCVYIGHRLSMVLQKINLKNVQSINLNNRSFYLSIFW